MSNVTRTKEISDLFQWSNNNSNNDNLDNENGRRNRLKTTGFKGDGSDYSNSEKIHAADFNFIFHHLAKDLFNIDASITELYKFVKSNRDEINTNSRTHGTFVTRYESERTTDNGRVAALETYKESANQWTWIKNKIENSGESLELGNVKIKNKNGAANANLNFQYGDNQTTHSLFVNGDNHFGLWNASNGNIWKVDGAGRVNFSNDIVLGDGNNPKYIANVHRPNSTHDAANKEYVDEKTANVAKTNAANTFEGITTFNQTVEFGGVLATISATPTQNTQITNKAYVDNKFKNVEHITTSSGEKYAANKKYVDDKKVETLREVDAKLRNIPTPTAGTHAANMSYVNTRLDNVATPTQPQHAANKEYVDEKLSSAIVVDNQNTFTADQIIGDDMKIIFGENGATYSLGKEGQNLKLKYGNNEIAEFNGLGDLQSGTLKEYIDQRTNIGALSGLWVNDDVNSSLSSSLHLGAYRPSGSGIRPPKSKLEITKNGGTNYNWDVVTRRNGSSDRTDIAFNDSGLTTSTLKSYIDNEVSRSASSIRSGIKDYKIYHKSSPSITFSSTRAGLYMLSSSEAQNATPLGLTIFIKFNTGTLRSFSINPLPDSLDTESQNINFTVVNKEDRYEWLNFFTVSPKTVQYTSYFSSRDWSQVDLTWNGRKSLYDAESSSSSESINKVWAVLSYQKK